MLDILTKINNTSLKEFEEMIKEKSMEILKNFNENKHTDKKHYEYLYDYYLGLEFVLSLVNEELADELYIANKEMYHL